MPAVRSDAAAVGLLCAGLLAASGAVAQASQVGAVGHARSVTSGAPQLKVAGNRLVNAHGKGVVLHGVDRSGGEFAFNACDARSCWAGQVAPVMARVPLIAGEIGENDCSDTYIAPLMRWLDARSASYLAWAWNADFACSAGPGLITSYAGTPTAYGAGYRSHLRRGA